jgi:predicted transcriptional regulator
MSMRGVTFTRNDHEDKQRVHAGVIAQEMEKAFPEVVFQNEDGTKAVAYANIVSVLIEAIKEQQGQIDDLKKQIDDLL